MEVITIRRISEYHRARIDRLTFMGFSPLSIRKRILEEEKISITTKSIKLYLARKNRASSTPTKRPNKRKLLAEPLRFIDQMIEMNDEITAPTLKKMIKQRFNMDVSTTTIKVARKQLGWTATTTKYCQIVRDTNKAKRLKYAINCMRSGERFNGVIFTDESTVKTQSHVSRSFPRRGQLRRLKGIPKHPYQVHVWGGISLRGTTEIAIFTGRMDSVGYQEILAEHLLPFIHQTYPDGHRLYQDNDPKHKSKSTTKWMEEHGVTTMPAPPESPDLNPIEMVWAAMKHYVRTIVRPTTKDQLVAGIRRYWDSLTPEICRRYISHLRKAIPKVLESDGAATGY